MASVITSPLTSDPKELKRVLSGVCNILNKLITALPSDSTASDVAGIVSDYNDLLAFIRSLNTR
jgi:hypothetical protein